MKKCPRCGNYMSFNMRYNAGYPVVEYNCGCGYSTKNETYYTDNKTQMNKNKYSAATNCVLK